MLNELVSCPFYNKEKNKIEFGLRPVNGIIFIWPIPVTQLRGFHLPEDDSYFKSTKQFYDNRGIVLASPEYFIDRKGRRTPIGVKPGDMVIYSTKIPQAWKNFKVTSPVDNRVYKVVYCSFADVYLQVLEEVPNAGGAKS